MDKKIWNGRNVFITGATGLLGSWITEEMIKQGAETTILCRDWVAKSKLLDSDVYNKVNVVRGDLIDYELLLRTINEYEIDTVFHLGAQTIVGTANREPIGTFSSNIKGSWNILDACRRIDTVKRVVVASSDKAYGSSEKLPYTEETPLCGEYPYDVSKSCTDLIAKSYFKTYGLPIAITRCGNLYGAGDLNFNRIIPGTIKSALENKNPIIRSDGTPIRDYLYLKDAVSGYLTIAMNLEDKKVKGESFNLSTKNKLSVIQVVDTILKVMGSDLKPEIENIAKNEIQDQYLSTEKAKKVLNWEAKFSLEEGIKETIPWYKKVLGQ